MFVPIRSARQRAGLTLMELVVVLVILAALSALVIPRLGFLQSQSTQVSGAAGSADLMNNLETYKLTAGSYPQRFDSLLASGAKGLSPALWSSPGISSPFIMATPETDPMFGASLGYSFASGGSNAAYYVVDQDADYVVGAGIDPNQSFNTVRQLNFGTDNFAIVQQATAGTTLTNTFAANIWQQAGFPSTTAFNSTDSTTVYTAPTSVTGVTLVAFGVGQQNSAVGGTMATAPLQTGQDPSVYGRFIAIFAVYGTGATNGNGISIAGKGAELKLVVDSFYQTISGNIANFKASGPINGPVQ